MFKYSLSKNWLCLALAWLLIVVFSATVASGLSIRDPKYNGQWQDYGNGWKYCYYTTGDAAYWKDGSALRFAYAYTSGKWWDNDLTGSWRRIGTDSLFPNFIGDGEFHNLHDGWSYQYIASADTAYWKDGSALRFAYDYNLGRWWDNNLTGTWARVGINGLSSSFLGDGAYHSLKNGWSYLYNSSADYSYWKDGSALRFAYDYNLGRWWDNSLTGTWARVGVNGLSSSFLGDGAYHSLKNGWSYLYNSSADYSYPLSFYKKFWV